MSQSFKKSPVSKQKNILEYFKGPSKNRTLAKQGDADLDISIICDSSDEDSKNKTFIKFCKDYKSSANIKKRKRNSSDDEIKTILDHTTSGSENVLSKKSSNIHSNSNIYTSTQKNSSESSYTSKIKDNILRSIENSNVICLDDCDSVPDELEKVVTKCSDKVVATTEGKQVVDEVINVSDDMIDECFRDLEISYEVLSSDKEESLLNLEEWQKCIILSVDNINSIISIKVQSKTSTACATCLLKQTWTQLKFEVLQTVNILARKMDDGIYEINNDYGYIIISPNILISGTALVGSMYCPRKSVINCTYGGHNTNNKLMTCGFLIHELLQESLKRDICSFDAIKNICYELTHRRQTIFKLYDVQMGSKETLKEILPFAEKVSNFMQNYIKPSTSTLNQRQIEKGNWDGYITKIHDIEENIWCPRFGIKGKIDVSVEAAIIKPKVVKHTTPTKSQVIPLELKTGRATMSAEHQGQVAIYNMMLRELDYDSPSGLLVYLRENIIKEVELNRREERDLIILRNHLVNYLNKKVQIVNNSMETDSKDDLLDQKPKFNVLLPELPPPLNSKHACKNCDQLVVCSFLQSKPIEDCTMRSQTVQYEDFYKETISHLTSQHMQYFKHWIQVLRMELCTRILNKPIWDIWERTPIERENKGKTLSNLIVKTVKFENGIYNTLFVTNVGPMKTRNFLSCGLIEGNYLIVSTSDRVSIAAGFVIHISKVSISLALERNLNDRYLNCVFCVDFYDTESHDAIYLTSLSLLMQNNDNAQRLREIIIEHKPPTFTNTVPKKVVQFAIDIMKNLNQMQQKAIYKVFTTKNYLLINGMPGTGKTQTLVVLIEILSMFKKTILITANTHSAVDNILGKLIENKRVHTKQILKIGSELRTNPIVQPYCESILTNNCRSVEELQEFYDNISIVGVTCFGAYHPLLDRKQFDICIVDECTQIIQSIVIKPLLSAKIFILVGDPEQLPPIVQNEQAKQMGLDESLFERLIDSNCIVHLTLQYRMNKPINTLANKLTYSGKLMCANTDVAESCLQFSKPLVIKENWLHSICDNSLCNAIKFIDTGNTIDINNKFVDDFQTKYSNEFDDINLNMNKLNNFCEVAIILHIVRIFLNGGIRINDIGIITPFQAQVKLLKLAMKTLERHYQREIEINTVDQYQGRDKQIILFSCTRNVIQEKCILTDKRRLNVAITRAKLKLLLIGNKEAMIAYKPFEKLFACLEMHQMKKLIENEEQFNWKNILEELINEIQN